MAESEEALLNHHTEDTDASIRCI